MMTVQDVALTMTDQDVVTMQKAEAAVGGKLRAEMSRREASSLASSLMDSVAVVIRMHGTETADHPRGGLTTIVGPTGRARGVAVDLHPIGEPSRDDRRGGPPSDRNAPESRRPGFDR